MELAIMKGGIGSEVEVGVEVGVQSEVGVEVEVRWKWK